MRPIVASIKMAGLRARQEIMESETVFASDSEAIQTKPQPPTPRLDCFALAAVTLATAIPWRALRGASSPREDGVDCLAALLSADGVQKIM